MIANSIYPRLFFPFALTLLVIALVAWWIATALLERTLEKRLGEQLSHATTVLAEGNLPFTEGLLRRLGELLRADIVLIGADGKSIVTTRSGDGKMLGQAVAERFSAWQRTLAMPNQRKLDYQNTPYILSIRSLESGRDTRYVAVAALADLSTMRKTSREAAWWLGITSVLGVFGVAAIGHRVARAMTDPISALAAMANRIAAGDRAVRVPVRGPVEVASLSAALNTMADRLERYEKELVQTSRLAAVGQVTARVAHEIRNPLTAIKMQVQLLDDSSSPEHRATTGTLLTEIRRLELIVKSTLQQGHVSVPVRRATDLNSLVTDILELVDGQFTHCGVELQTLLDPLLPAVVLDADQIKQVLLNLLVNARDALPEGGVVRVTTSCVANAREVVLSVEDSGPGIPAAQRVGLFVAAVSEKANGFGLGLPLSKELVELNNGRIDVGESTLGGACFSIAFSVGD